jgi:hypothetical protein
MWTELLYFCADIWRTSQRFLVELTPLLPPRLKLFHGHDQQNPLAESQSETQKAPKISCEKMVTMRQAHFLLKSGSSEVALSSQLSSASAPANCGEELVSVSCGGDDLRKSPLGDDLRKSQRRTITVAPAPQ